jgi:hypothetical protein
MAKQEELKGGLQGGWFLEISDQWPGQVSEQHSAVARNQYYLVVILTTH